MGRTGLRKVPSESVLALACSTSSELDLKPSGAGCDSAQGNKRQALTSEVLASSTLSHRTSEWCRQPKGAASKAWESSLLGHGEAEKGASESPNTPWDFPCSSDDAESQARCSSRGSGQRQSDDSGRRSLDSTSSREEPECRSEADQFDLAESAFLTDSVLNRRFSVNLGISQRKTLLNTLSEREAAQEAVEYGFTAPASMPGQLVSGLPLARRSTSLCDTTLATDLATRNDMDSDEEDSDRFTACTASQLTGHSRSSMYLSDGQAAAELFLRLNHARQTVSFVRNQVTRFSALDRAEMTIWEALDLLGGLREYETALMEHPDTDASIPMLEHSFQTAEACRLAYPHDDWLHLVGLIHSLGKLLGHTEIAGEPQWAICGESFPVGCRFDPAIACSQFFSVNPDRRSRQYNTAPGIYRPGGGLASVYMSWSASEYLYMLLLLNRTLLPPQALFLIRYQKFTALEQSRAYRSLMCKADQRYLPWLGKFRQLSSYKRVPLEGAFKGDDLKAYYNGLIKKYIPAARLRF